MKNWNFVLAIVLASALCGCSAGISLQQGRSTYFNTADQVAREEWMAKRAKEETKRLQVIKKSLEKEKKAVQKRRAEYAKQAELREEIDRLLRERRGYVR